MEGRRIGNKQYEARLIQLLRRRFEQAKLKVEDHLKVGKLPVEVDMIASRGKLTNLSDVPELFSYFRRFNLMEIKTERDRLLPGDLLKLQAYACLYMEKQKIYSFADVTATAIVHHLTPVVSTRLLALGFKSTTTAGVYKCDSLLPMFLISFEDAPEKLMPDELLVFSNAKRRQKVFLSSIGKKEKDPLIETLADLYENEVIKLMALHIRKESMPKYIRALGKDRVLAALSTGDLLSGLSKGDLLSGLSKGDLLSALSKEEIAAALGEEEMLELLLAKIGREQLLERLDQLTKAKN